MYTQCSHCRTVFEVTPEDLKRARGTVRCGQCGELFDAIEKLSPAPPDAGAADDEGTWEASREHGGEEPDGALDGEPDEESRYDDDTPLADEAASDEDEEGPTDPNEGPLQGHDEETTASAEEDDQRAVGEFTEVDRGAEGLEDQDEWLSLLAELDLDGNSVDTPEAGAAASGDTKSPVEDSDGREGAEDASLDTARESEQQPDFAASQEPGEDSTEDEERERALALSGALFDELMQSGEFRALLSRDSVLAAPAAPDAADEGDAAETGSGVDEADSSAEGVSAQAEAEEPFDSPAGKIPRRNRLLWSSIAALLILILGAQIIHAQRSELATLPNFGPKLQSFYGVFGVDIQPSWDIGSLCVESSSADASPDALEIASVIVHRGDRPQPYPLLQVALTDRWQGVIGTRSVTAEEYLRAGELHDLKIRPGDRLRTMARLVDPGSEAAGYELHVCYPEREGGLRCSGACP